jgi:nitrite reductase/ring-hydroxylating ferredoxin subunit
VQSFRERKIRDKSRVVFATGGGKIFAVDKVCPFFFIFGFSLSLSSF